MKKIILLSFFSVILLSSCGEKNKQSQEQGKADMPVEIQEPVITITPSSQSQTSTQPTEQDIPEETQQIEAQPHSYTFAEKLAQAALERTIHDVTYDGRYIKIAYPMGDVPDSIGVCTDVVIRSYRQLGIDLQQLVHEDMRQHFSEYPNQRRWGLSKPDPNIDHRRVPNLRVFFSRHGASLPVTRNPEDYQPGDLVTWKLNEKMGHIGIVAEQVTEEDPQRHYIIHNIGRGPELGDMLFEYEITGHYRYPVDNNIVNN